MKIDLTGKINRLTIINSIRKKGHRTKYFCQCECGKHTIVEGSKIKNGSTKSCGCLHTESNRSKHNKYKKPQGVASRNRVIGNYKNNARHKNLEYNLTNEKIINLFQANCYYCGTEPKSIYHSKNYNGDYKYNGIDRLNNDQGYIENNVVSCCSKCNYIKNKHNHDDFVAWIKAVNDNLKKNKII